MIFKLQQFHQILFNLSCRDVMLYIFHQLVDLINTSVYSMTRFQSDDMFLQFTKYVVWEYFGFGK